MIVITKQKISNNYSIYQQVYEDKVQIRTGNIIYSFKYNAYMFILSNNSCIWLPCWKVAKIKFGQNQCDAEIGYLVELNAQDFEKIKTYPNNFEGFYFNESDILKTYIDAKNLAQEQEKLNLMVKLEN